MNTTTTTSIIQTLTHSISHTHKHTSSPHTLHFTNPNFQIRHRRNNHNVLVFNAIDGGGGDVDTAVVEKDTTEELKRRRFEVLDGYPTPFGATVRDNGVNFAIFSRNAVSARLCLMTLDDLPQKLVNGPAYPIELVKAKGHCSVGSGILLGMSLVLEKC
ncbi:isoamylase 1, chloroplastic [Tanacetum coccineum]